MLYKICLLGGTRANNEYYSMLLRSRIGAAMVADDKKLSSFLRSPNDMVHLEAILEYYKIVVKKRPIETFYSSEDDPC